MVKIRPRGGRPPQRPPPGSVPGVPSQWGRYITLHVSTQHQTSVLRARAVPRNFVWGGDGLIGSKHPSPPTPKFSFFPDFGHFIFKMLENTQFSSASRKKILKYNFWEDVPRWCIDCAGRAPPPPVSRFRRPCYRAPPGSGYGNSPVSLQIVLDVLTPCRPSLPTVQLGTCGAFPLDHIPNVTDTCDRWRDGVVRSSARRDFLVIQLSRSESDRSERSTNPVRWAHWRGQTFPGMGQAKHSRPEEKGPENRGVAAPLDSSSSSARPAKDTAEEYREQAIARRSIGHRLHGSGFRRPCEKHPPAGKPSRNVDSNVPSTTTRTNEGHVASRETKDDTGDSELPDNPMQRNANQDRGGQCSHWDAWQAWHRTRRRREKRKLESKLRRLVRCTFDFMCVSHSKSYVPSKQAIFSIWAQSR